MDGVNRKILEYLDDDGRMSYTEISNRLDVSEGTVRNRVDRMIEEGVIEKFTVERGESGVKAFVMVTVASDFDFSTVDKLFPRSSHVYEVAGETDIIAELTGESSSEVNKLIDKIREVEGVESTRTMMVLSEHG